MRTGTVRGTVRWLGSLLLLCCSTGALAFDLGKIRREPPDDQFVSAVPMFDIERCAIEVDAISVPTVYRQPDRPDQEMMVWVTAIVLEMESTSAGTLVKTHFQSPGGRKARKRLLACAGQRVDD